jgi:hypothetical protein
MDVTHVHYDQAHATPDRSARVRLKIVEQAW